LPCPATGASVRRSHLAERQQKWRSQTLLGHDDEFGSAANCTLPNSAPCRATTSARIVATAASNVRDARNRWFMC
jgi:hypothetical protein